MNKNFLALEFDTVLEKLKNEATCDDAKDLALEIKPSSDKSYVEELLSQTEDAFGLLARFGAPSFSGLKNVNNCLARAASGGSLNQAELLNIGFTLRAIRSLEEWRGHCSSVKSSLDFFFDGIISNKYLETKIFSSIISEDEIADKASEELYEIRKKIRTKASSIRDKLDGMIHSTHYQKFLQEAIVTQRNGRFVVPVKSEYRSEVSGLVHDTSASGSTAFIEPSSVVEANNDIKVLEGKERDEINRILYELSVEAGQFTESIKNSYESAVKLNLIFAKAHLAYKMKASKPIINKEGVTNLKNARHPLIDKNRVVPTNISIGESYDTIIITGPNTGGKTVSIKTLGLLTLMTECGLLIPVSDQSQVAIYDKILVDIGDEQSISQNLSTFSSHITNVISIMKEANENSLVLIDELGAGTDPVEGAALAISIIEKIRLKGAKVAATTHYAELKEYALSTNGVINGACEFNVETLRPTYKLLIGVPGRSNAFAISEHLGMEKDVLDDARKIVSNDNREFENVVSKLEESRKELEDEKIIAEEISAKAQKILDNANSEKSKIEELKKHEVDMAKNEAKRIIDSAKRQSADFLLALERLKKEQTKSNATELAKKTRREIKARMGEFDDLINTEDTEDIFDGYVLPRHVKVGDHVYIKGLGEGDVLEVGGKILVQSGMIKTRVAEDSLKLLQKPKKKPQKATRNFVRATSRADESVTTSLDLRGKTVDEALVELGMFIDRCVLNGISEVTIIHGKGTGALRSAVTDELKNHPNIAEYRLGKYGEGENGVTIAKIL